ncbi:MAG: hypothetical protein AAB851_02340 [Patescibacteria group bacterium]
MTEKEFKKFSNEKIEGKLYMTKNELDHLYEMMHSVRSGNNLAYTEALYTILKIKKMIELI